MQVIISTQKNFWGFQVRQCMQPARCHRWKEGARVWQVAAFCCGAIARFCFCTRFWVRPWDKPPDMIKTKPGSRPPGAPPKESNFAHRQLSSLSPKMFSYILPHSVLSLCLVCVISLVFKRLGDSKGIVQGPHPTQNRCSLSEHNSKDMYITAKQSQYE